MLRTRKAATAEQRWCEWCSEAAHTAGAQRRELDVTACVVPVLAGIVRLWQSAHLALTLDVTALGQRFVVLSVSVADRDSGRLGGSARRPQRCVAMRTVAPPAPPATDHSPRLDGDRPGRPRLDACWL